MTEPRPSAKDRILQAATDLFLHQGYHGTGTSAIISAAGVSKGSFFYHFADKESLLLEAIELYGNIALLIPFRAALKKHENPQEGLIAFINALEAWFASENFKGGCLLGNMTLELSDSSPQVSAKLATIFESWQSELRSYLAGRSLNIDTNQFISLYIGTIEGITLATRAHKNKEKAATDFEAIRSLVRVMVPSTVSSDRNRH